MDGGGGEKPFSTGALSVIDGLCQRWGVGPDTVLAQDAGVVIGILTAIDEVSGAEQLLTDEEQMMRDLAAHMEILE
jgi:hypothetical protein